MDDFLGIALHMLLLFHSAGVFRFIPTSLLKMYLLTQSFYWQALYHALPMAYVTVSKLQEKLKGEAAQSAVKKFIDRMIKEGMVEAKTTRRLGVFSNTLLQCVRIPGLLQT